MAMVVTQPCQNCKHKACMVVCPCDCFYEDETMLYINPDECIDCEACISECPVEAIYHEDNVPEPWHHFIEWNAQRSKECPPASPSVV